MLDISPLATDCKPASHDRSESGDVAELPNGLDPVRHRIICEHFFGFKPVGAIAAEIVQDLAFRRKVQRLHAKGPRIIAELLAELGAERGLGTAIDQIVDHYLELDDAALDATNGRDFPPNPLHEVDDVGASGKADDG